MNTVSVSYTHLDVYKRQLDEMLTKLQDMGYEIVPVSKLIMTEGYHMDANGMQIKD